MDLGSFCFGICIRGWAGLGVLRRIEGLGWMERVGLWVRNLWAFCVDADTQCFLDR